MRFSTFISLTLVAITSLSLFACGGGGGSSTPALTADKMTAVTPVLNGGTTTIAFDFGVANGGKIVTFTATPSATLTPPSTVLDSFGKASVVVSAAPPDVTVNVTASIPGYTGTKAVQFIKQPDTVIVHVATDKTIKNLYNLTFGLNHDLGTKFVSGSITPFKNYSSYNNVAKSNTIAAGNDVYSWFIYVLGLNVAPSNAVLDITFTKDPAFASPGVPGFSVFQFPGNPQDLSFRNYSGTFPNSSAQKNLTPSNFILSIDYYLGNILLATK